MTIIVLFVLFVQFALAQQVSNLQLSAYAQYARSVFSSADEKRNGPLLWTNVTKATGLPNNFVGVSYAAAVPRAGLALADYTVCACVSLLYGVCVCARI